MESRENIDRLNELKYLSVGKLLWKYSLPAIVGTVVMSLYNIIDRIFIGQGVGPDAIAGLAITFPVMNLASALGMLIGVGSSSRISIVLGQGNKESETYWKTDNGQKVTFEFRDESDSGSFYLDGKRENTNKIPSRPLRADL